METKDFIIPVIILAIIALFVSGIIKLPNTAQSVVGTDCPPFKTNSVNGVYNTGTIWIATDCNSDGNYESYKWDYTESMPSQGPISLLDTTDGKKYKCFNGASGWQVQIWPNGANMPYKYYSYSAQAGADLTCTPACTPNWVCSAWSVCSNSLQTRTCTDSNSCGSTTGKPVESQSCTVDTSFKCDADGDGIIKKSELVNTLQKWIDSGGQ